MKKKEIHTYYNYQFKHTAVSVTDHPDIQAKKIKGSEITGTVYLFPIN